MRARHVVRQLALDAGLRLIDQTKLVTAVSELARNTVVHGGGGNMTAGVVENSGRTGVWAEFEDEGPGSPTSTRRCARGSAPATASVWALAAPGGSSTSSR